MKLKGQFTVTDKYVLFWGSTFSNFADTPFVATVNGEKLNFNNTEQYFMYRKALEFGDKAVAVDILKLGSNPKIAKSLGRKVRNYDDEVWNKIRYQVMLEGNLEKYRQNADAREQLLDKYLRDKSFVEASPLDTIWGIGLSEEDPDANDNTKWKGQNLLGKVLDEVRSILLKDENTI